MSTDQTRLLIDLGNSRLKWAIYSGRNSEHLIDSGQMDHRGDPDDPSRLLTGLERHWGHLARPEQVWVSAVASIAQRQQLEEWIRDHWELTPVYAEARAMEFGVTNAYQRATDLGVDRWLALIAARQEFPGQALCIADCGSAVTIDVMDQAGQHLGGQILPGTQAMQDALGQNTSLGPRPLGDEITREQFFGDTTSACIRSGILNAQAALIERAVIRSQSLLGEQPRLLLTGGGADGIKTLLSLPYNQCPDLVLEGLLRRVQAPEEVQE